MQDLLTEKQPENSLEIRCLTAEEQQRLVGAFAWLIQQDKKQNPELYKNKIKQND